MVSANTRAGNEALGAEHVGDEAGRDLRQIAGACRGERQRAERGGGREDEEQSSAGHGWLRLERSPVMSPKPRPPARRISQIGSPKTEAASPISKISSCSNGLPIRPLRR
jgi:hypothetical protein